MSSWGRARGTPRFRRWTPSRGRARLSSTGCLPVYSTCLPRFAEGESRAAGDQPVGMRFHRHPLRASAATLPRSVRLPEDKTRTIDSAVCARELTSSNSVSADPPGSSLADPLVRPAAEWTCAPRDDLERARDVGRATCCPRARRSGSGQERRFLGGVLRAERDARGSRSFPLGAEPAVGHSPPPLPPRWGRGEAVSNTVRLPDRAESEAPVRDLTPDLGMIAPTAWCRGVVLTGRAATRRLPTRVRGSSRRPRRARGPGHRSATGARRALLGGDIIGKTIPVTTGLGLGCVKLEVTGDRVA